MPTPAYNAYQRRPPPPDAEHSALVRWLSIELQNIQRAIRPAALRQVSAAYTATPTDDVILVDCTAGGVTITLPTAGRAQYCRLTVKKIDATANAVTLGGTVDGTASPTIVVPMMSLTVMSDGTAYWIV